MVRRAGRPCHRVAFQPLGPHASYGLDAVKWQVRHEGVPGHALGAAGVHEAIYSLLMLNNDFLAESANIKQVVEEAEGMKMLTSRHDGAVERVMSNSFGFGGTNCCLVFDRYTE